MMQKKDYTQKIKAEASRLGFFQCGIAKANLLTDDAMRLETWLQKGFQGKMSYMENHFDKRIDPRLLVDGAKSVVTLLHNYFPPNEIDSKNYKISKYAYGEDYHNVIKDKLKSLLLFIRNEIGEVNGRGFVDSAPVLERAWAVKSGAGWVGKNGNLISKQKGSFFFIATLIIDLELELDANFQTDHCGTCTKCIDACPTEAILPNKEINGSQCISYYTIELKEAVINADKAWEDWIFGCDVCQDVCPWNRFSTPHSEPRFDLKDGIKNFDTSDWFDVSDEIFNKVFHDSPIKRTKLLGLQRNINFVKKQKGR
jgi:epoxyqueuosine reductase